MMIGYDIDIIYLFLTSDLGFFIFSKFYSGPQFDSTGFRYKKAYLDETYIPIPSAQQAIELRNLLNQLNFQSTIDEVIFKIWSEIIGLNQDEREYISNYKHNLLHQAFNEFNLIG
ncbi:hypothetical protein [Siphonobacter sp. BAB-5405]|uniref:hypothetical protein n=1 Tax=Siphonobacter sp. BAB-5405 TaxID=1864825 RepID=UPI0011AFC94A|nr:hypothetical protein [Siphonobacter sp. BAB-5405]